MRKKAEKPDQKASSNVPLRVDSVSKSFAGKKVLDEVSLSVEKGEIFGLVGLNGVGKTTLIKIILDLLSSDSGEVTLFGKTVSEPKNRKNICYLPEKFHPSQLLKGNEFIDLSLAYYGKKANKKHAQEYAKTVDLDPSVLDKKVSSYSKGMGQKLGLLSVFLSDVPLLLLDEPMSGLDPRARIEVKELFKSYKAQGNSIFFSSHILADIEEVCDRIAIIHGGGLVFTGKPSEFLKQQGKKNLEQAFLQAIS